MLPSEETASNMQHHLTTIGKLNIMVQEGKIFKITCTDSTQQSSSWDTKRQSATQEISHRFNTWILFYQHTSLRPFITFIFRRWNICVVTKVYYSPTNAQVTVLKKILKFTLKYLRHVSVQSHLHQGAHYPCLLKLHRINQTPMNHNWLF